MSKYTLMIWAKISKVAQANSKMRLTRIFHAPERFIGKAFRGAAVVNLLQALDNAANGYLRECPVGEIFYAFLLKV